MLVLRMFQLFMHSMKFKGVEQHWTPPTFTVWSKKEEKRVFFCVS